MARITVARNVRVYTTYEVADDSIPDEWMETLTDDITEDQAMASVIVAELEARVGRDEVPFDSLDVLMGDEADEPEYNIWLEPADE